MKEKKEPFFPKGYFKPKNLKLLILSAGDLPEVLRGSWKWWKGHFASERRFKSNYRRVLEEGKDMTLDERIERVQAKLDIRELTWGQRDSLDGALKFAMDETRSPSVRIYSIESAELQLMYIDQRKEAI